MPTGIPPSIQTVISTIQNQINYIVTYLEIPSYNDLSTQCRLAFHDCYQALQSTSALLQITLRPLFILFILISRYVLIILKILCEHTIDHGIVACKELFKQCQIALHWFITYQKGLSKKGIYIELGFIVTCIALYYIEKHLQQKKYISKLHTWYKQQKYTVQRKYNTIVETIAQTSLILALLLPHVLYMMMILIFKYVVPSWFIQYLVMNTILSDLVAFYIPLVKTIIVVFKCKKCCDVGQRELEGNSNHNQNKIGNNDSSSLQQQEQQQQSGTNNGGYFSFLKSKRNMQNENNETNINNITKTTKQGKTSSSTSSTKLNINDLNDISQEASELLKYWIVYAILTALIQTAILVPIFGRILYNANPINVKKATASASRWSTITTNSTSSKKRLLDKIVIPTRIIEECKFFFFVWLRLLPTSLTSFNNTSRQQERDGGMTLMSTKDTSIVTGSVKNKIKSIEKHQSSSTKRANETSLNKQTKQQSIQRDGGDKPFSNQPLDIVYEILSPIAISFVSVSTNAINVTTTTSNYNINNTDQSLSSTSFDTFKTKCVTFCQTVLSAMVWTKLISESTKVFIVNTFSQCRQLLPSAITLTMPSYFTSYGVIYVRLIVPCANASTAYGNYQCMEKDMDNFEFAIVDNDGFVNDRWISVSLQVIQSLQYWIIQAVVSWILLSFAPVLAWIPFSTHMVWLLWAYVQIDGNTKKLYNVIEWDLIAFGILKYDPCQQSSKDKPEENIVVTDIKETTTMQLLNSIMKKVPSQISNDTRSEDDKVVSATTVLEEESETDIVNNEVIECSSSDVVNQETS